jgi:hypothetical protein
MEGITHSIMIGIEDAMITTGRITTDFVELKREYNTHNQFFYLPILKGGTQSLSS